MTGRLKHIRFTKEQERAECFSCTAWYQYALSNVLINPVGIMNDGIHKWPDGVQ